MSAERAYRSLLRLYPNDYRALFALEMQNAFDRAAEERRLLGRLGFGRFLLREFIGLSNGIAGEWITKLTTDGSTRGRRLPDLRMMRPPDIARELWFAGAYRSLGEDSQPAEVLEAEARVSALVQRMVQAIAQHDFPGARRCSHEEREASDELRRLRKKHDIADLEKDRCS